MRRRLLPHVCMLVTLLATSPVAAAKPAPSWAQAELKAVVAAGLMAKEAAARPNDPLTRGELETLVAGLLHAEPVPAATPASTVTLSALDAKLVTTLGLAGTAKLFSRGAKNAGLTIPARFGTETVARLLGLRTNHPAALDKLELSPGEPATHAEAAYSAAQILRFGDWEPQDLQTLAATFVLPAPTPWQKRILTTAARFIGYPFVWRIYKLEQYPGGGKLADVLEGRTTYALSGEVPAVRRIPLAKLEPADVVFFGAKGSRSKPAQVDHMGIYLGSGWFIHSSRYGVALAPLSGWYEKRFAWGRRPLAEAGLVSAS